MMSAYPVVGNIWDVDEHIVGAEPSLDSIPDRLVTRLLTVIIGEVFGASLGFVVVRERQLQRAHPAVSSDL
jgi:hypothetical protein